MAPRAEIDFAADHPAANGHFPGNPIIPGAVLVDEILKAIGAAESRSLETCHIRSVKFLRVVRPGDRVLIEWSKDGDGAMTIRCTTQQGAVLLGAVEGI